MDMLCQSGSFAGVCRVSIGSVVWPPHFSVQDMHKIEGWSKVRGGGPKWRIQGLWAILSRSDHKLEPAESWGGRLSLNEWSPQGFPPKKIDTFCTLAFVPQTPKKKCQWKKKTQWVYASPVWQQVITCCSCVATWSLLRPASSIIRPLYEWFLSAAFENDHYVNSQNIVLSHCLGSCVGSWWVTNINLASACVIIFHHGRR